MNGENVLSKKYALSMKCCPNRLGGTQMISLLHLDFNDKVPVSFLLYKVSIFRLPPPPVPSSAL